MWLWLHFQLISPPFKMFSKVAIIHVQCWMESNPNVCHIDLAVLQCHIHQSFKMSNYLLLEHFLNILQYCHHAGLGFTQYKMRRSLHFILIVYVYYIIITVKHSLSSLCVMSVVYIPFRWWPTII